MEIFLQDPDSSFRLPPGGSIARLLDAVQAPMLPVLLHSRHPLAELGEMIAAMALVRECGQGRRAVVVATETPTLGWWQQVRQAGATRQLALAASPRSSGLLDQEQVIDIRAAPCPALRLLDGEDGSVSVCGDEKGRLALAFHHYRRWCLSDPEHCPHRISLS